MDEKNKKPDIAIGLFAGQNRELAQKCPNSKTTPSLAAHKAVKCYVCFRVHEHNAIQNNYSTQVLACTTQKPSLSTRLLV